MGDANGNCIPLSWENRRAPIAREAALAASARRLTSPGGWPTSVGKIGEGQLAVTIRPLGAADRAEWDRLYAGYAAFYRVEQTGAMRDRVWGWLLDPAHPVTGLVAERDGGLVAEGQGGLVGLAHFRAFARPLSASTGGFLDDLYVDPAARGSGAAQALIAAVAEAGRAQGWTVIRWITAEDNARARAVYDRVASRTPWVTYDIRL